MEASDLDSKNMAGALAEFNPERFGFRPFHAGWIKDDGELGPIVICELGWEHAQAPTYDIVDGVRAEIDALTYVVRLQARVWGMPPEELVPVNLLAILPDTGGGTLVAYRHDLGFNADGWLGFLIGAGSSAGTFVSHMLGVNETVRGARNIGWCLKIVQAHLALRSGHTRMRWTFDPMRGANARLNLEKLGAYVDELTIDKYGVLKSELYGDVSSDRFTAKWELVSPATHSRVHAVHAGNYQPLTPLDISHIPELTADNAVNFKRQSPPNLRYRIPGDIDWLMHTNPGAARRWREEVRELLSGLLPTKSRLFQNVEVDGPAAVSVEAEPGGYRITGLATGPNDVGARDSYYLLERHD